MAEILKERSELDPQFQWDLTPMYESDAAWEAALESLDRCHGFDSGARAAHG